MNKEGKSYNQASKKAAVRFKPSTLNMFNVNQTFLIQSCLFIYGI